MIPFNNIYYLGDEDMLNFVLCDDNPNILDRLSQMLENIFVRYDYNAKISYKCSNADDLLDYLNKNNIDVLFLDINLKNKLTGLDIAEQIRKRNKKIYIIFTTGHLEYALVAYKYKTFDYIPKPFVSERLELTISRLFEDIRSSVSNFIKVGNSQMLIKENDILYIKKENMKLIYHTLFQDYSSYIAFNKIENTLPTNFVRCHKSYIINLNSISHIDTLKNCIYLYNNNICPIGPKYKNNLLEVLKNYESTTKDNIYFNESKCRAN